MSIDTEEALDKYEKRLEVKGSFLDLHLVI